MYSIGCFALRSSYPILFVQLVMLLYSDKKPGALDPSRPRRPSPAALQETASAMPLTASNLITLPAPHKTFYPQHQFRCTRSSSRCTGGASAGPGGAESEAARDFTTHLKLINTIAKAVVELNLPRSTTTRCWCVMVSVTISADVARTLISCKALTMYYPTLHLELVHYVVHAGHVGYELPCRGWWVCCHLRLLRAGGNRKASGRLMGARDGLQ
ncbi:hypothetical protein C8R44DRAFT_892579 [Mycena epipterygia]|nr:hypothetical protein C8R44DRAFT_892579 [Mycena epipterygia]